MQFTKKQTAAYGIGAVGKDMVYALSATYVMYYYQDLLHLPATFVGLVLMLARVFDAVNDPFMGILVAKTRTRFGRFRPWLFSGTVLNAVVLYAMFAAPDLPQNALMVFFTVIYLLWGVTYTMMDIPYWSMIPAVADKPEDREKLSVVGRTCAGVGSALIQVGTLMAVSLLGGGDECRGFALVALVVSLVFLVTEIVLCIVVREKETTDMQTTSVGEMFRSLLSNDQAMITVLAILLINSALYLTSNLVIYFFKYDVGGADWKMKYTYFTMVGGIAQILGMMLLYPLARKKLSNTALFRMALCMAMVGYALILTACLTGLSSSMIILCICAVLVFAANGLLAVLTTVFLSSTADYGELRNGHREESVIFSMQTFVVKGAAGLSVFIAGLGLDLIGMQGNTAETGEIVAQSAGTIMGLRLLMTILPILGLVGAFIFFVRKFTLTDDVVKENARILAQKREK